MERIAIKTDQPYEMVIGKDLFGTSPAEIKAALGRLPERAALVTDSNVSPLYAGAVSGALSDAGVSVSLVEFPAGEENKNLESYGAILEQLARAGLTRSDLVIALGGGVAGDMGGFAAATFLRGIRYVQMPTTYLAAVDSSVGGKTAVDLASGKNLCGAFWQPSLVLLSYDTFRTLSPSEFLDGSAEAFKAAMLRKADLADDVLAAVSSVDMGAGNEKEIPDVFERVIRQSVEIKKAVVEEDERDTGARQLLNFGHTIGHSIEMLSGFAMSHGQAVARGMAAEAKAAYRTGLTGTDVSPYIEDMLGRMGFDLEISMSTDDILRFASSDKKVRGSEITVVVPEEIGRCVLKKIPVGDLREYIDAGIRD